jgi:hypothetical protein
LKEESKKGNNERNRQIDEAIKNKEVNFLERLEWFKRLPSDFICIIDFRATF